MMGIQTMACAICLSAAEIGRYGPLAAAVKSTEDDNVPASPEHMWDLSLASGFTLVWQFGPDGPRSNALAVTIISGVPVCAGHVSKMIGPDRPIVGPRRH